AVASAQDWRAATVHFDVVLHHGSSSSLREVNQILASRAGPIVSVRAFEPGDWDVSLEGLIVERALSVN
ncbi:hypothetical protein DSI31_19035, partial [Mycobacterium tuberculosis]